MGQFVWDDLYGMICMGQFVWDILYGTICMGHFVWDNLYGSELSSPPGTRGRDHHCILIH